MRQNKYRGFAADEKETSGEAWNLTHLVLVMSTGVIMKNIHNLELEKYKDDSKYKKIADGIYQVLFDGKNGIHEKRDYVAAFSFSLEEGENLQYPLEDILGKYYAHVSEFIQYDESNPVMQLELCTGDELNCMEKLKEIIGNRVYNQEYVSENDKKSYVKLVID